MRSRKANLWRLGESEPSLNPFSIEVLVLLLSTVGAGLRVEFSKIRRAYMAGRKSPASQGESDSPKSCRSRQALSSFQGIQWKPNLLSHIQMVRVSQFWIELLDL